MEYTEETGEVVCTASASAIRKLHARYFNYMLSKGIYLAPSQFEAMFVSYAHSEEDIEKTCEAIRRYVS